MKRPNLEPRVYHPRQPIFCQRGSYDVALSKKCSWRQCFMVDWSVRGRSVQNTQVKRKNVQ